MTNKLRNILSLLTIALTLGACEDYTKYHYNAEVFEVNATVDDYSMLESDTIQVPDGQLAVVTMRQTGDTIAVLPMTCDIMVPTNMPDMTTRAAMGEKSYDVNYISAVGGTFNANQQFIYDSYYTVAFEDSKEADYDFNDLILNICIDNRAPRSTSSKDDFKARLFVNPIALGSSKNIGFGIRLADGTEILLSDNVRRDYFNGIQGFINTVYGQKDILRFPVREIYTQDEWLGSIYFFIETDGERRYALNTKNTDKVLDDKGCPYGIVISNCAGNDANVASKISSADKATFKEHPSNSSDYLFKVRTWWQYPTEGTSLDAVYSYAPYAKVPYTGTFNWILRAGRSMSEVCYYNRANRSKAFPCIVFKADGSVDTENTIYYTKFLP